MRDANTDADPSCSENLLQLLAHCDSLALGNGYLLVSKAGLGLCDRQLFTASGQHGFEVVGGGAVLGGQRHTPGRIHRCNFVHRIQPLSVRLC
jgi:hypothetical protein